MSEPNVMVVEGPGLAPVVRRLDTPLPQAGAALVTVIATSLDAWDVRLLDGQIPGSAWPIVPGRFFVGAIEALGAGLTEDATGQRLRPGTPVLIPSVIPCGTCAPCRIPPLHAPGCLAPVRLGVDPGVGLTGGLGETVLVARGAIHALPVTLPPFLATLAEPFASCLLACARVQAVARFPIGASVVVIGRDATALLAIIAARELGAGPVVAVGGPDAPFLRMARACGAEATIDVTEVTDPTERETIIRETVGGAGADLVLSTGGVPPDGLGCLRAGGTLVTMGAGDGPADPAAVALIPERQLAVLGVSGFRPADIPVALAMLFRIRGRYPFAAMHARFPATVAGVTDALTAIRAGATPSTLILHRADLAG